MILLGLGSNMGDREAWLAAAVRRLDTHPQITVKRMSSLYETEPFGFQDQAAFLNAVVWIESDLMPEELLASCQSIESELGRKRTIRWGPRTIDIDLLIFDKIRVNTANLILPHPCLTKRRFVLLPMAEIAEELIVDGYTVQELAASCPDTGRVELYRRIPAVKETSYEICKDFTDERFDRRGTCKSG